MSRKPWPLDYRITAMNDRRTSQQRLCSRENAERVATRMFEHSGRQMIVIRTGDPERPYIATDQPFWTGGTVDIVVTA